MSTLTSTERSEVSSIPLICRGWRVLVLLFCFLPQLFYWDFTLVFCFPDPPEFYQPVQFPGGPVNESTTVTLTCDLDANPSPNNITWENLAATDVSGSVVETVYDSTLILEKISREQAGYYRCQANNGIPIGNNDVYSSLVTVSVHCKLIVTSDWELFLSSFRTEKYISEIYENWKRSLKWIEIA